MASHTLLWKVVLASVLCLTVGGFANPVLSSSLGDKSDDFTGHSSTNENSILLLNRQPINNWGDETISSLQGALKEKSSGIPVLRLASPRQIGDQYYLPFPRKRGGKVILVDVVDYISKDKAQGEDGVPAVVVSGKGGGISGNMMRFSGK